jgi:hypothetical protein
MPGIVNSDWKQTESSEHAQAERTCVNAFKSYKNNNQKQRTLSQDLTNFQEKWIKYTSFRPGMRFCLKHICVIYETIV